MVPIGEDTVVVALLGIDQGRSSGVWRTDSIILALINQQAKRMGLLSVPRDLWAYIPGHGYGRINTVDTMGEQAHGPGGGLALLDQTFRHNLGLPIDHIVRIDFHGFVRLIDALGGVTVDVEKPIADAFPDPLSPGDDSHPTGMFEMDLPAGPQHLDGRTALAYCRSRLTTSDFDRSRRQRQVLVALWEQAFTLQTLAQAPQLWATLGDAFETDLTMAQAIQLAHRVQGIDPRNVRSASLDAATVTPWTTPQGEQVLLPQTDAIRQAILDLLSPPGSFDNES
jgi:LCP family protein required for cell wall assembly